MVKLEDTPPPLPILLWRKKKKQKHGCWACPCNMETGGCLFRLLNAPKSWRARPGLLLFAQHSFAIGSTMQNNDFSILLSAQKHTDSTTKKKNGYDGCDRICILQRADLACRTGMVVRKNRTHWSHRGAKHNWALALMDLRITSTSPAWAPGWFHPRKNMINWEFLFKLNFQTVTEESGGKGWKKRGSDRQADRQRGLG